MNIDEIIEKFGLMPEQEDINTIRDLLRDQIAKETREQGSGDTEVMRLLCVQLFNFGNVEDISLIWDAKMTSMDAGIAIEVQLLCGIGIEQTKEYLLNCTYQWANKVFQYLIECEQSGDFLNFSKENQMDFYREYFEC